MPERSKWQSRALLAVLAIALTAVGAHAESREAMALLSEGNALYAQRCYAEAIAKYDAAIALDAAYSAAYNNRGLALARQGDYTNAIAAVQQAMSLTGTPDQRFHLNLGRIRAMQGQLSEAISEFDTALSIRPPYPAIVSRYDSKIVCNRAWCKDELGLYDEAIADWQLVLSYFPNHTGAMMGLAVSKAKVGLTDEAKWWLLDAVAITSGDDTRSFSNWLGRRNLRTLWGEDFPMANADSAARFVSARNLIEKGDYAGAATILEQLSLDEPNSAIVHDFHARALQLNNPSDHRATAEYAATSSLLPESSVDSYPSGASLFVDYYPAGTGPLTQRLFPGTHSIVAKKLPWLGSTFGYVSQTTGTTVAIDMTKEPWLDLRRVVQGSSVKVLPNVLEPGVSHTIDLTALMNLSYCRSFGIIKDSDTQPYSFVLYAADGCYVGSESGVSATLTSETPWIVIDKGNASLATDDRLFRFHVLPDARANPTDAVFLVNWTSSMDTGLLSFQVSPDSDHDGILDCDEELVGTIVISVTPASAPWSFTDGDGQTHSGVGSTTLHDMPAGEIRMTWGPLTDYTSPATPAVQILSPDSTLTLTGTYSRQGGTVQVVPVPLTAEWWVVDGDGNHRYGRGSQTLICVATGQISLIWGEIADYNKPVAPEPQDLQVDGTVLFRGTYTRKTGTVQVVVTPTTAPWSFSDCDGQTHSGTGPQTVESVPTGPIAFRWGDLPDYTATYSPPPEVVNEGGLVTVSGAYVRHVGTVQIEATPAVAWSFTDGDGKTWSGDGNGTVRNVPTGEITLTWSPLNGYLSPGSPVSQTLSRDGTVTFAGTYTCVVGDVQVNVTPASASWSFTDGAGLAHNGIGSMTVPNVPRGEIRLTWGAFPGFAAPENPGPQTLDPEGTVTFTGTYTRQTGTVQVNAPSAAGWSFTDGDSREHSGSGTQTVTGIPTGSIALTWAGMSNYYTPLNPTPQTLDANGTVTFTGLYSRQTGTVQISASPATAPWSFTDGDGGTHSGTGTKTVTSVPTGYVSLTWGTLANHIVPPGPYPHDQFLAARGTLTFTGTYRATGTVRIDATPASAPWSFTDADGQVRTGVGSQTASNVPTGNLSLRWGALMSYNAPQDPPNRTLNLGETATFTGVYRAIGTVYVQATPATAPWTFTDGDGRPHSGTGTQWVPGIPTGPITLSWNPLTGYSAPPAQPVQTLVIGERVAFSGDYVGVGTVQVNVSPSMAPWSFTDGNDHVHSGLGSQTVTGVATGWREGVYMTWGRLDGFVISGQDLGGFHSLTPGGTTAYAATYLRTTGSVEISVGSDSGTGSSGFSWSFTDGDGKTHRGTGSQVVNGVPTGQISLAWEDAPNYTSPELPSSQTLVYGDIVRFQGVFGRHRGAVQIVASSFRVPWSFVDGDGQTHTGRGSQTVPAPTGAISFTWLPLEGYVTPDPATIAQVLARNCTVTFSADYIEEEPPAGCAGGPVGGGTPKGRMGDLVLMGMLVLILAVRGRSKRQVRTVEPSDREA